MTKDGVCFPFSNDSYRRGRAEAHLSTWDLAKNRVMEDCGASFDKAWADMRAGQPRLFILKSAGVGIGCVLMADGIYNLVKGYGEEVEDTLLANKVGRNFVRMGTGVTEMLMGAAALYTALTKGHLVGK